MNERAALTLRQALAEYRRANNLPADETLLRSWTCRIGPVTARLPNFRWRRNAILAHDLHHVLTGYPCTLRGECQTAAWEFGAGPMPHWAARLFCLPLVPLGLVWLPRATASAFLAGRRSRSLHGATLRSAFLETPMEVVRENPSLALRWSLRDRARFAVLIVEAGLVVLAPTVLVAGLMLIILDG